MFDPRDFLNSIPVAGGLLSNLWGDPDQEAHQRSYRQAQEQMAKQRAYQMQARTNMMNQGAAAFGPANQMLGQMMGQRGPGAQALDLSQILKNPMGGQQQNDIREAAFGGGQVPGNPQMMGRNNMNNAFMNMHPSKKIRG